MVPPPAAEAVQFRLLSRLCTTRFYDNDLLGPDVDLRRSFIWLVAGLMTPSLYLSVKVLNKYSSLAMALGPEAVATHAVFEKTLLVGFAMVAMGMLTVLAWDALLLDRRDVLVLGSLPVRWRTLLAAKGATLIVFWAMTTAAVNIVSAVVFSLVVGEHLGLLRHLAAHLVATAAASASVFGLLLTLQVVAVSALGPRASRALAAGIQLVFGVLLLSVLLLLPWMAQGVFRAIAAEAGAPWWWAYLPPVWFVGVYEQLAGHSWPAFHGLAARGWLLALGAPAAAVLVTIAGYRRHLRRQTAGSSGVPARTGRALAVLTRLAPHGPTRALALFTLATLGRSGHHRLVVGLAAGAALALGLVGLLRLASYQPIPWSPPPIALLCLPLVTTFVVTAAVSRLFSAPAELHARWTFDAAEPADRGAALDGVRRALWGVGLVAPGLVALGTGVFLGRPVLALLHAGWCLAVGALVVEVWMAQLLHVPFTIPRDPAGARGQITWPLYGAGLLFVGYTMTGIEAMLVDAPAWLATLSALLLLAAIGWRRWQRRRRVRHVAFAGQDPIVALQTLGLSGGLPASSSPGEAG